MSVLASIREESKENRESVSTTVNRLLYEHVEHRVINLPSDFIVMPKAVLAELLSRVPEEHLRQLARRDADKFGKRAVLQRHSELTAEGIAGFLENWAERGGHGDYRLTVEGGNKRITILHDLGIAYSTYVAAFEEALFQMAGVGLRVTTTDGAVISELLSKQPNA